MTSPEPGALPFISGGMIWDGITRYENVKPPGMAICYLLRMYEDGTRRFSESFGTGSPMRTMEIMVERGWETTIGIAIEAPHRTIDGESINHHNGVGFLHYDGRINSDPANQYYYVNDFRAHAARYAQHLNETLNYDVLGSADEWKRIVVKQTMIALLGLGERRFAEWEAIGPEDLIVGGVYDGTLEWKRDEQAYKDTYTALCGQCDLDLYAQEFFFDADLPAFRDHGRQGVVFGANHATTPWAPLFFGSVDQTEQTVGEFYNELDLHYNRLLRHYAQVVAVQDRRTEA